MGVKIMKKLKELKQNYKTGKELWEDFVYFVAMQRWVEAYCTYNGINTYKKMHPILYYFAKHFSQKEKLSE